MPKAQLYCKVIVYTYIVDFRLGVNLNAPKWQTCCTASIRYTILWSKWNESWLFANVCDWRCLLLGVFGCLLLLLKNFELLAEIFPSFSNVFSWSTILDINLENFWPGTVPGNRAAFHFTVIKTSYHVVLIVFWKLIAEVTFSPSLLLATMSSRYEDAESLLYGDLQGKVAVDPPTPSVSEVIWVGWFSFTYVANG